MGVDVLPFFSFFFLWHSFEYLFSSNVFSCAFRLPQCWKGRSWSVFSVLSSSLYVFMVKRLGKGKRVCLCVRVYLSLRKTRERVCEQLHNVVISIELSQEQIERFFLQYISLFYGTNNFISEKYRAENMAISSFTCWAQTFGCEKSINYFSVPFFTLGKSMDPSVSKSN